MKKKLIIFILSLLFSLFLFVEPIKTKAYEDNTMIEYSVSGYNDIVIFSTFNPDIIGSSSYADSGMLLHCGVDLLRYNGNAYNDYDIIRVNDNHVINSYLNKDLFCYYIAYRGDTSGAFSYTLFIFSYNNWNPNIIGWSQLARIDYVVGALDTKLYLSTFTTNYICFQAPNSETKLDIVNRLWQEFIQTGENEINGLPYLITNGQLDLYKDGYQTGYERGFQLGQQAIENIPSSFLSPILNFFTDFFTLEIAPGIYIGYIIIIPLAFGVLGLVLYFWRKD